MGGGTKQKSESKTELPAWYVPYAKQGLELGQKVAQQGYAPYQGPDVAAFAPQQVQGMQMANDWASAFGGKGAKSADVSKQLMPAQTFAGGLKGYSSYGGYTEALDKLKKNQPGLYAYIQSMSIDPQTGAPAKAFQDMNKTFGGPPSGPPVAPAVPPGQAGGTPQSQQPQVPWWQMVGQAGPQGSGGRR